MSAILAQPTPVDATMKEKNSPLSTITTLFDNMFSQRDKIESTKATGDITSSNTPEDSLSPLDTPKSEPAVPNVVMPDIQPVPEIDTFEPQQAVDVLLDAISIAPETEATTIEGCCWRLRVLCREADGPGVTVGANQCDEAKAAQAVVAAMGALPSVRPVQLQALAVLVNLGAADVFHFATNARRNNAVEAGAFPAIVSAMTNHVDDLELNEMACLALQSCCIGDDPRALTRRQMADGAGAIEAVLVAMREHTAAAPWFHEVGAATLRRLVHKVKTSRAKAVQLGAREAWLRQPTEDTGIVSSRSAGGSGTSRLTKGRPPVKQGQLEA